MRDSIKDAIGQTVQDLVNSGMNVSFTKKEMDSLGVVIPKIKLMPEQIKSIRKQMNLS